MTATAETSTIEVSLWRGGKDGRYQAFSVPQRANQTVLDVVTWVQRHADPTLSYRFACRVGMCGVLRHDGQRPAALDLPHAHLQGDRERQARDRPARQPAGHQGSGLRHAPVLREVAGCQGRVRAEQDARRCHREDRARHRAAHGGRCGHRMHQLRGVLCRLRYGALERGLSRAGRAQSGVDARQRRARCRQPRTPHRHRGKRGLPRLPLAPELPGALSQQAQPHRLHRRPQAARPCRPTSRGSCDGARRSTHHAVILGLVPGIHRAADAVPVRYERNAAAWSAPAPLDRGDKPRDDSPRHRRRADHERPPLHPAAGDGA